MNLAETQAALTAAIKGNKDRRIMEAIKQSAFFSRADRINIYRMNWLHARTEALNQLFPICQTIVGQQCFRQLCRYYCEQITDDTWDLNRCGVAFSQFLTELSTHTELNLFPWLPTLPYLPDLAHLEYCLNEAYYAPDSISLAPEILLSLSDEQHMTLNCELVADLTCFSTPWPLYQLWHDYNRQQLKDTLAADTDRQYLIIYRQQYSPTIETVDLHQFMLINNLQSGLTLGDIASLDTAQQQLQYLAACWQKGWISGITYAG